MFKYLKPFQKYLKPHYVNYFECFIILIVVNLIGLVSPFLFKLIIDNALPNKNIQLLIIILLGIIGANILRSGFSLLVNFFYVYISQKIHYNIRMDFISHLIHLPQKFFDTKKVGELVSRIGDVKAVNTIFDTVFFDFTVNIFTFSINFIAALIINPILTGVLIASTPLYYFYSRIMGNIRKKREQITWGKNKEIQSKNIENLSGIKTVKSLTSETNIIRKLRLMYLDLRSYTLGTRLIMSTGKIINDFIGNFSNAVIFFVGIYLVIMEHMTLGDWFAFNAISRHVVSPLLTFTQVHQKIKEASAGIERLEEILKLNTETSNKNSNHYVTDGNIVFKGITFSYSTNGKVLNDINLNIKSGESIAFVGRSGSGKTTISNLLSAFYYSQYGDILIDGVSIREYDVKNLRKDIGIVLQEPFLFNGTIKQNLKMGIKKFTHKEMIEACKMANAMEFIEKLPDKFNTIVGERGSNLSGGQKQRLAIARAFLKNPKIFILDEATSSLDNESEKVVQEALRRIMKGRTSIIIAHRLSTVKDADKICVVDKGKICEIGTHQELLKKKGIYYMLYQGINKHTNPTPI